MDIYRSDAVTFLVDEEKNALIPPFTSMPGVGEQAAVNIVEERKNGPFLSAEELLVRCNKVSKSVVETLGENRRARLHAKIDADQSVCVRRGL